MVPDKSTRYSDDNQEQSSQNDEQGDGFATVKDFGSAFEKFTDFVEREIQDKGKKCELVVEGEWVVDKLVQFS